MLKNTLKLMLLLCISRLALAGQVHVDIYQSEEGARQITLTVDPNLEIWRLKKYVFDSEQVDGQKYDLFIDGKKLKDNDRLGGYNDYSRYHIHFTVEKKR